MREPVDFKTNNNGWGWLDWIGNGWHPGFDANYGSGSDDHGLPCYSISKAKVVFARDGGKGWGNMVVLELINYPGIWALYGHLDEIRVKEGDVIEESVIVGTIGDAHGLYSDHLHFGLLKEKLNRWTDYIIGWSKERVESVYLNPMKWIADKIEEENQAEPEIVSWCKLNKVITKWTIPYQADELKLGYIAYKTGYLTASKSQRESIFTIEAINDEMI